MLPFEEDIRAEVLIAYWLENQSIQLDDLVIRPEGTFRRSFSKDVLSVEAADKSKGSISTVNISREGLYDMLPEGLFHQAEQKYNKSTTDAIEETERYNKEEKNARAFFLPLEQEFYRQKVWLESTEMKYWLNSAHPNNVKMLMRFWLLDQSLLTSKQCITLTSLMPHLHNIVGDIQLTKHSLEALLDEQVDINIIYSKQETIDDDLLSVLGDITLGADAILGTSWYNDDPSIQVEIGPIKRNSLSQYLTGGRTNNLLPILYGYLFQAEVNVETRIQVLDEEAEFILSEVEYASHLGYNTII
jgi:hypothetical protein